jgi:hypothetical protein
MLNWRHSRVQFIIRHHPTKLDRKRALLSLSIVGQIFELGYPILAPSRLRISPRIRPAPNSLAFYSPISGENGVSGDRLSMRQHYTIAPGIYERGKNVLNFKRAKFINGQKRHAPWRYLALDLARGDFLQLAIP